MINLQSIFVILFENMLCLSTVLILGGWFVASLCQIVLWALKISVGFGCWNWSADSCAGNYPHDYRSRYKLVKVNIKL